MSRNDLFLLLACAVVAVTMCDSARQSRTSVTTIASLLSPPHDLEILRQASDFR